MDYTNAWIIQIHRLHRVMDYTNALIIQIHKLYKFIELHKYIDYSN